MENLTSRQQKILQILTRETMYYRGKTIAEELNISLRTLQADISDINRGQKEKLILSNNLGYYLNSDLLQECAMSIQPIKKENELAPIVHKMMLEDRAWNLDELSEDCYISMSTLTNRLKQIQPLLKKNGLRLVKQKNHVWIEGKEYDKCRYINHLILDEVTPLFLNLESCAKYFGDMDLMRIKSFVLEAIEKYNCHIENCYADNLYLNITIALSRMRKDYHMEKLREIEVDAFSMEYQIAQEICARYATHYTLRITPEDIAYLAMLITGQVKPQMQQDRKTQESNLVSEQLKRDVGDILMKTFNYYMLNIDYEPFLYNFVLHVDSLIKRAMNQQSVNNVSAENIKATCPFIYDVAVYIAKELEEKFKITISDDEIGFISIHIGFVIENSTHENNRIRVLVVCNDYHHTADNILARLKENYADMIDITNIISQVNQKSLDTASDLIISTMPLDLVGKKVVIISPFYTMMDHLTIDQAIHTCLKEQKAKREQQLLMSYFHESLFFKRTDLSNQEDVIRFLGDQVVTFGLASEGFSDSVLKREQMSSTCFFELFAIPHAIELNAKKTMFCVLINEHGIAWGPYHIKIVLMIAVQQKDRKSFMKIYNSIIQFLWNKEKVAKLVGVQNFTEFLECLKEDMPQER